MAQPRPVGTPGRRAPVVASQRLSSPAILLVLACLLASACASTPPPAPAPLSGLVVEEVKPGNVAAKAGIQAGDLLLRWHRAKAGGELVSPFDLDQVQVEEAPRGTVALDATRAGKPVSFEIGESDWGLKVRPRLADQADQELTEARQAAGVEGAERMQALARGEERPSVRAWLLVTAAELAGVETSEELWAEAAASARQDPATRAWVHERHGKALRVANRLDEAAAVLSLALEDRSDGSLAAAVSLSSLGLAARSRGDLEAAEGYHQRALEIKGHLAPGSLQEAASLNNLAIVAHQRGDLATAEELQRRALAIKERLAPSSLEVATSLGNLGVVAFDRGDLEAAEGLLQRALEISERLGPGGTEVAAALGNLGSVALARGDLAAAEALQRRSLEIKERLAPDSLPVAASLANLGNVLRALGDLEGADDLYRRALEIFERLAPGTLDVAVILSNLGVVSRERDDLAAAEESLRRALEIQNRIAPGSLDVASSLHNLGLVAADRGDLEAAEGLYRRGLWIRERLAPDSTEIAIGLHQLALVLREEGRVSEAVESLQKAVRTLEAQQLRLGGSPERLGDFRAQHLVIYRDLVEFLVDLGRGEEAFGVLEAARARAMLAMLAERDLVARDVPPELERERRVANADHDWTMVALGQLQAADEEERVQLLAELDTIRQRQDDIRARVRAASPRLADLRYPEPLKLRAARQALDPGTLLLEYSLGEENSYLFAVGPGPERLAVYPLAIGEGALREQVTQLRRLIERGQVEAGLPGDQASREALVESSRSLYSTLIAPALPEIGACSRLVIVPDGALHVLPFAALLDPTAGEDRYLVEEKPLSVVASATVMAQLEQRRRPRGETRLVAFGDPRYPQAAVEGSAPVLGSARRSGLSLDPLPASRLEVESIGRLFGGGVTLWLGEDATEERAKAVGEGVTTLHFATHGFVDERRPLSSGLALSIPDQVAEGQDNGLLQAWEVFEQVRLDAELVTLSACATALGKEVAGEGILGLTRAFQYAGARTVLASLWSVADESTAELMRRFYSNLQAGLPKDEALRQAQIELIRGPVELAAAGETSRRPDATHPFYWAAFELVGDWK